MTTANPTLGSPGVDANEALGTVGTIRLFGRAFAYVRPFARGFAVKTLLTTLSLAPLLLLPWPAKILIDHVVLGVPIGGSSAYPPFIEPLIAPLAGADPLTIVSWTVGALALFMFVVGAVGSQGPERDITNGNLASGRDTATQTENQANTSWSFAGGLFGLFEFRWTIRLSQELNHYYRSRLFERMQHLPMTSFDDERIGDAIYRVMYDTPAITGMAYQLLLTPLVAPLQILATVAIVYMTYGDMPLIALGALGFGPLVFAATLPFAGAVRRAAEESRTTGATTTTTVEEGVTNILAVQSLGAEERERSRFGRDSWGSFGAYRKLVRVVIYLTLAATLVGLPYFIWLFHYVVSLVIEGAISVGDFAVLTTYFFTILGSAIRIGSLWISVQGNAAGLQRVFWLMDLPSEADDAAGQRITELRKGVQLEAVDFEYPDGTRALREVDLEMRVGQLTAIVGPAGAGKTTLAYLLPRFLEPTRGRVLVDGTDARELDRESLRALTSFVFQETALFDASIADNIRMARPEASDEEIRRAAHIAGADEFIDALPDGYDTPLGRSGGKLSVGQKQRLSITRALVRDAPILILDEPTAALDPATEMRLVAALREASRDRLVLVIAHRLSTIRAADQIVFLEDGAIRERGSHRELMSREAGAYRHFVDLQTRGTAA